MSGYFGASALIGSATSLKVAAITAAPASARLLKIDGKVAGILGVDGADREALLLGELLQRGDHRIDRAVVAGGLGMDEGDETGIGGIGKPRQAEASRPAGHHHAGRRLQETPPRQCPSIQTEFEFPVHLFIPLFGACSRSARPLRHWLLSEYPCEFRAAGSAPAPPQRSARGGQAGHDGRTGAGGQTRASGEACRCERDARIQLQIASSRPPSLAATSTIDAS